MRPRAFFASGVGEVRLSVGSITQTDFGYTFQRNNSYIKLLDYRFRSYSPELGRFVSPDTIVPDFSNPQSLNRYSYVNNRPINLNDPSGHKYCDGNNLDDECKSITSEDYNEALFYMYRWNVVGNWTTRKSGSLLDVAISIEKSISSITHNNGRGWMNRNLQGTTFVYNETSIDFLQVVDLFRDGEGVTPGITPNIGNQQTIYLNKYGLNSTTIIHELGHVADNTSNSDSICSSTWCGGGAGDDLLNSIGFATSGIRWKKDIKSQIPEDYLWSNRVNQGYGNTASAEYFAEAFFWFIVDPSKLPNTNVQQWMNDFLSR
jgi:RHS repeat-associated protein